MELIARVLITIPDDKWQESLAELVEERTAKLEKKKADYGTLSYASALKRVKPSAESDMKYSLSKGIENVLQNHYKHDSEVQKIEFIEFEESEVKENGAGKG